ncbi:MAG: hypothetical protein FD163_2332 [Hyphomonadaceae bacterium]|nr:MAG: hypothetical protein FD128_2081 [Hyphomonadaceae bacterium]KAF0183612.1 MAG: hypothetical protein FD163_2332 [Hyphomonadaceae bacterium]
MELFRFLEESATKSESYFQRFLAKEDLARVKKLLEMAKTAENITNFLKDGIFIGWTKDDLRTHELKPAIEPLLVKIFEFVKSEPSQEIDAQIMQLWHEFHELRLKTLLHCL